MAEFVDLIRTYGCSENNDYQLRYGTRWVLQQLESKKDGKWIDYNKNGDDTYDLIHDPWAGSSAVMIHGNVEPVVAGSYGAAFYDMIKTGSIREYDPSFSSLTLTSSSRGGEGGRGGRAPHNDDDETREDAPARDHRRQRAWNARRRRHD